MTSKSIELIKPDITQTGNGRAARLLANLGQLRQKTLAKLALTWRGRSGSESPAKRLPKERPYRYCHIKHACIVASRQAAKLLGLPVSVLEHIRAAGVFKAKPRVGYEQSWHLDDVEEFLKSVLALAASSSFSLEECVELSQLMRLKLRNDSAKADIVTAVFDGRLSVVGRSGADLSGLQLDKAQVESFLLASRVETESGTYSFQEAAKITGLDIMAIAPAVELQLFEAEERNTRRRIPVASVEQFNRTYVPLSWLAAHSGTRAFPLCCFIGKQDLPVTLVPRSNGQSAQPIVRRELVTRISELWLTAKRNKIPKENAANRIPAETMYSEMLRNYLSSLLKSGKTLPMRGGIPNKLAIARAWGFSRDVLYDYPSVLALLTEYTG